MAEGTPIILHWSPLLHRSFGRGARGRGLIVRVANVSFDDAVYRAAQLQYDLDFPGISMLYSWPSKGSEAGYAADGDSIERVALT